MAGKTGNGEQVELLRGIWGEIKGLNSRVDRLDQGLTDLRAEVRKTNERLDVTNERLDMTNERLDRIERRQTESEIRLATELVHVAGAVSQVRDLLQENLSVRNQVEDHEHRIHLLEDASMRK